MFIDPTPFFRMFLEMAQAISAQQQLDFEREQCQRAYALAKELHVLREAYADVAGVDWDAELQQLRKVVDGNKATHAYCPLGWL